MLSQIPDFGSNINVAAIHSGTYVLGPGFRSVVWVQGCNLNCPGCIAQDWIPFTTARVVSPEVLAEELLSEPSVTGITISGGEPMLQAQGLLKLVEEVRSNRNINILVFTGYRLEYLKSSPPNAYVKDFLSVIDGLIDGAYIARLNDNKGMRGSSNQRLFTFTDRLSTMNLEVAPRKVEVNVHDGNLFIVGVPDHSTLKTFNKFSSRIVAQG